MSRTAWPAPDKRQIPPVENQLAIFLGTLHANIKTTIRMRRKHSFYWYNFQEDTFRDCGEISDWNTVKLSKIPMFPHRRWEAAATYLLHCTSCALNYYSIYHNYISLLSEWENVCAWPIMREAGDQEYVHYYDSGRFARGVTVSVKAMRVPLYVW